MEPISGREVSVRLLYATVPVSPDGLSTVECLSCGKSLDIHQPDPELPDRMLATCDECSSWHLVECQPAAQAAVIVLLPDVSGFGPPEPLSPARPEAPPPEASIPDQDSG